MLQAILTTMRPRQWTKNLFLYAGIVFSLNAFNPMLLSIVTAGFFVFCAVSGSIYVLNDIVDIEKDRRHPKKSTRPIAAGLLPIPVAWGAFGLLLAGSLASAWLLNVWFLVICLSYMGMNIGYSFYLKRVVILDVMTIAAGFVLRAIAGAVLIKVEISPWLLICTFFLALFLAFCKRRNELLMMDLEKGTFRDVLVQYSPEVLDQMTAVVTASSLMAYSFYTISESVMQRFHTEHLFLTIPFVLFGIFRYLYLVHRENLGGNPEMILLRDLPMIADLVLWVLAVFLILYMGSHGA